MNQNKRLVFVAILASVFFVIILYLLYLLNLKNTQPVISNSRPQTTGNFVLPTVSPTTIPAAEIPSNWKTYRNEKFGYEFRYPQNWEINRIVGSPPKLTDEQLAQTQYISLSNPNVVTGTDNGDQIQFFPKWGHPDPNTSQIQIIPISCNENSLLTVCLNKIFGNKIPTYTPDKSSSYPAIRVESENSNNIFNTEVYFLHNSQILYSKLTVTNSIRKESSLAVFNQILSTFKFIKPKQEAISLKTYENKKVGLQFQYPSTSTLQKDWLSIDGTLEFSDFVLNRESTAETLSNYVDRLKDTTSSISPQFQTINGLPIAQWVGYYNNVPTYYVTFLKGNYAYSLGVNIFDETPDATTVFSKLTQILSTFKFL